MTENQQEALHIRLKLFMDSTGLNNSQFADKLGVPRPSLSQIITGRNKKVSDLLLTQVHNAFPNLNMLWLMFGEGEMLTSANVGVAEGIRNENVDSTEDSGYFVFENNEFPDNPTGDEKANSPTVTQEVGKNRQEIGGISPKLTLLTADIERLSDDISKKINREISDKIEKKPRRVVKITVFYDDNSYECFIPGSE